MLASWYPMTLCIPSITVLFMCQYLTQWWNESYFFIFIKTPFFRSIEIAILHPKIFFITPPNHHHCDHHRAQLPSSSAIITQANLFDYVIYSSAGSPAQLKSKLLAHIGHFCSYTAAVEMELRSLDDREGAEYNGVGLIEISKIFVTKVGSFIEYHHLTGCM